MRMGPPVCALAVLAVVSGLSTTLAQTPPASPRGGAPAPAQSKTGGFKVGDTVRVVTGFGWVEAKVVRASGSTYRVNVGGVEVDKQYPFEVRRVGPLTADDHALGQYDLHDRVQVLSENRWIDGEVIAMQQSGMIPEYQVSLPGKMTAWVRPEQMRFGGVPAAPAAPKTGVPPKPGLVSCAGKFEGRYSTSGSGPVLTILFREGKATVSDPFGGKDEFECWTGSGKVYLYDPAQRDGPELDINNDGTLDTPFGEVRKKGN